MLAWTVGRHADQSGPGKSHRRTQQTHTTGIYARRPRTFCARRGGAAQRAAGNLERRLALAYLKEFAPRPRSSLRGVARVGMHTGDAQRGTQRGDGSARPLCRATQCSASECSWQGAHHRAQHTLAGMPSSLPPACCTQTFPGHSQPASQHAGRWRRHHTGRWESPRGTARQKCRHGMMQERHTTDAPLQQSGRAGSAHDDAAWPIADVTLAGSAVCRGTPDGAARSAERVPATGGLCRWPEFVTKYSN